MGVTAKQLGAVLTDGFQERGFDVDTIDGPDNDFYMYVFDSGVRQTGHFRVASNGKILEILPPDQVVTKAIRDMGYGSRLGKDSKREIFVAYEVVTPESAEEGDVEERGEDRTDEITPSFDETYVDAAINYLKHEGALYRTNRDEWFDGPSDTNYQTGAETTYTYHLKGFAKAEEAAIRKAMGARR
jgi:hypothetical protein